jgi:hypothetical protein
MLSFAATSIPTVGESRIKTLGLLQPLGDQRLSAGCRLERVFTGESTDGTFNESSSIHRFTSILSFALLMNLILDRILLENRKHYVFPHRLIHHKPMLQSIFGHVRDPRAYCIHSAGGIDLPPAYEDFSFVGRFSFRRAIAPVRFFPEPITQ